MIKEEKIEFFFVKSKYNAADSFTKALGAKEFDDYPRCCFECDFVEAQGNFSIMNKDNERIRQGD